MKVTGCAVEAGAVHGGDVGPGARHEGAGQRQAALLAVVELAVLALGQREHGVAHHAEVSLARGVGAVEDEHREVDPDLAGGQPDPVGGVHGRDHVGDQRAAASSSYDVTRACGRCMTGVPQRVIGRTVPPSGSGPYGAWTVSLGHARSMARPSDPATGVVGHVTGATARTCSAVCNSELHYLACP